MLGIYLIQWSFEKIKPIMSRRPEVLQANKQFNAFTRNDLHKFSKRYRLVYMFMAPFVFVRYVIVWFSIIILTTVCNLIAKLSSVPKGQPYS